MSGYGTAAAAPWYRDASDCGTATLAAQVQRSGRRHHGNAVGHVVDDREVVGDEQIGEAQLARRSLSRFRTCACTDTSRAETGSSQIMKSGERQRAGNTDALALAAGETVRIAAQEAADRDRPPSSARRRGQSAHPDCRRSAICHRLAQDVEYRHARRQEAARILKIPSGSGDARERARRRAGRPDRPCRPREAISPECRALSRA